jgi:hypothetical protein
MSISNYSFLKIWQIWGIPFLKILGMNYMPFFIVTKWWPQKGGKKKKTLPHTLKE